MKFIYCAFFVVIFISVSPAQKRYLITFTDKGQITDGILQKNSNAWYSAKQTISERSFMRRMKSRGEGEAIDYDDVPIYEPYIRKLENMGCRIHRRLRWFNAVSVLAGEDIINSLKVLPFIKSVQKVKRLSFTPMADPLPENALSNITPPADALHYGNSFYQNELSQIPQVHQAGINGSGVLIGILDTGFDHQRHQSLAGRTIIAEWDFVFNDSVTANQPADLFSQHNHGTYVFSILAGYKDSLLIGPAFGASFVLAKTEDVSGETHVEEDNFAAAIEWMDSIGVDITSSSLGYNLFDPGNFSYSYQDMDGKTTIVTRALEKAYSKGILPFTAAGNEADDPWYYIIAPGDAPNAITVGAVTSNDSVAVFSSRGPTADGRIKPDVVAMGVSVFGAAASSDNMYMYNSGTSAATPIAAGIGALLLSFHPEISNAQARNILLSTANNFRTPNNFRGYGLISAKSALEYPVVIQKDGVNKIRKSFLDAISPASVKFIYTLNGADYDTISFKLENGSKYFVELPAISTGSLINFFISYNDNSGNQKREPASGEYTLFYGDVVINRETSAPPDNFVLFQNFPNPFNPETTIRFFSPRAGNVNVDIFSITGEKVFRLFNGAVQRGYTTLNWNGRNNDGISVASGVYFCILQSESQRYAIKMLLVK